jgi:hypothetical protein
MQGKRLEGYSHQAAAVVVDGCPLTAEFEKGD